MIKKIIGATVGTPISPSKIADKLKPVKTVNGKEPDANGNVEVVGNNGKDGVSVTHSWNGTKLTVTSASGTSSADLKGAKGDTGPQGPKGDTGSQGPKGADGKSAYAFAQDGGYEGTEEEFAKCLAAIPDCSGKYIPNDTIVIGQHKVGSMWNLLQQDIEVGVPYAVYINGTEYFCIAGKNLGAIYLGNITLMDGESTQPHNNEPFCIVWGDQTISGGPFFKDDTLSDSITLKVTGATVTTGKELPEEYLPGCVVKSVNGNTPDENGNVEVEGGGSASIDVTASVGQTIVVEEVDADGKPTKWKAAEFQERTHGKGIMELYNATLTGLAESEALIEGFSMQGGETYYIAWNGVEYTCVCVEVPDTGGMCYIGNGSFFDLEDTGEPFIIVKGTEDGVNFFTIATSTDGVDEATVVIKSTGYVPIPAQYLTNAHPYYIEVTGSGTDEDPYVCNDTVANVEALFDTGRLVFVKIKTYAASGIVFMETLYSYHLRVMESEAGYTIIFIAQWAKSTSISLNRLDLIPQTDGTYTVTVKELT